MLLKMVFTYNVVLSFTQGNEVSFNLGTEICFQADSWIACETLRDLIGKCLLYIQMKRSYSPKQDLYIQAVEMYEELRE